MSSGRRCPIPGCPHVYERTLSGWVVHVGTLAKHPEWHPRVTTSEERRELFRKEFPSFFRDMPKLAPTPCPVPGCEHQFERGKTGWYQHIALIDNHPNWHPETPEGPKRTALFKREFPELFPGDGQTSLPPSHKRSTRVMPPTVQAGPKRVVHPAVNRPAPPMRCPLRGCNHVFESGIEGWESHVANWDLHPWYLKEISSPSLRVQMFRRDFPGWFDQATAEGPFVPLVSSSATAILV